MKITRKSILSGVEHTMDIPVTLNQLQEWENGALIQDVMSNLTASEREFIKTGITDAEWEEFFE